MNFGQKVAYYLLIGTCKAIGWLPYHVLYYFFLEIIYFIVYKLFRYRVAVVRKNLRNSCPEKRDCDLRIIERKFYRHLAELFIDIPVICALSCEKLKKRYVFIDNDNFQKKVEGVTWISAMAHYGSWEYTINYKLYTDHEVDAVYKPLHSPVFEEFYKYLRSRCGAVPVAMDDIPKVVINNRKLGAIPIVIALISDQTPPEHAIHHWFNFFGQKTAFHMGMEKIALKFKIPVYFSRVKKIRRGYYSCEFIPLYNGTENLEEFELTQRYAIMLENMIRTAPELWLWSHKRWKHQPREGVKYR
ncbi:MAG: lysophospholipid acyltransferase family protein [Rikenellaceae bacterium]|nr:lysophospholipid acyltransferase family protein [Rikenellaceae bacterium]